MNELEVLKGLEKEGLLSEIEKSGLYDYGTSHMLLKDLIYEAKKECEEEKCSFHVVAALNNSDTERVLLNLLISETEAILEGLAALGHVLDAKELFLYIPDNKDDIEDFLTEEAKVYGIKIKKGLVNFREHKGALLCHIVTAKEISDLLNKRYKKGKYVCLNGKDIRHIDLETKITEIMDLTDGKSLFSGGRFIEIKENMTINDIDPQDGIVELITNKDCPIQVAEEKILLSRDQSCGKCVFCREGLIQLEGMTKDILEGKGKAVYLENMKEIGEAMLYSTNCSLGQNSSQIVLSALEIFQKEFDDHIRKKECAANICFSTESIYIDPFSCTGCMECMDVCPKDCIEGRKGYIHLIDEFECDKCGKCIEICEEEAIIRSSGKLPKLPEILTKCGKFKRR